MAGGGKGKWPACGREIPTSASVAAPIAARPNHFGGCAKETGFPAGFDDPAPPGNAGASGLVIRNPLVKDWTEGTEHDGEMHAQRR